MIQQFYSWVYIQKKKMKALIQNDTCLPMFTAFIYNCQHMEATQLSINRWIYKEGMV